MTTGLNISSEVPKMPAAEVAKRPVRIEKSGVEIGLNAAIVSVANDEPVVLVVRDDADRMGTAEGLPFAEASEQNRGLACPRGVGNSRGSVCTPPGFSDNRTHRRPRRPDSQACSLSSPPRLGGVGW